MPQTLSDRPLFFVFVREGNKEAISLLVEAEAEKNKPDLFGDYAFLEALKEKDLEFIDFLIKMKFSPHVTAQWNQNAAHLASIRGNKEIIKRLKKAGVDLNLEDHLGMRPLHHYASIWSDPRLIPFLTDKNSDINAKDKEGRTALHFSVFLRDPMDVKELNDKELSNLSFIKALVKKGADVFLRNEYGARASDLAIISKNPLAFEFLDNKEAELRKKECEASFRWSKKINAKIRK